MSLICTHVSTFKFMFEENLLTSDNRILQSLIERFCPQIRLAEITSEKHKVHEHLKTSADQHQRTMSAYQQKVTALQEECRAAKVRFSHRSSMSQLASSLLKGCGLTFQYLLLCRCIYQMNTSFSSFDTNLNPISTLSLE